MDEKLASQHYMCISVISGQWEKDNKRLCVMKPCLWLKVFPPLAAVKPGTTRSAGQHLTNELSGLLEYLCTGWIFLEYTEMMVAESKRTLG